MPLEDDLIQEDERSEGVQIQILNSHKKVEFYHFKVMSLKTHEDTKKASECKLLFHFYFKMLSKKKRDYLEGFDWDVNYEPNQRLYLSRDTRRLMEVINNFAATVYTRDPDYKNFSTTQETQTNSRKDDEEYKKS